MTKKKMDDATGVETTGHEWDGIRELNNPLVAVDTLWLYRLGYCLFCCLSRMANDFWRNKGLFGVFNPCRSRKRHHCA